MTRTHSTRRPVSGFTLIELLVVTLILSILMAVAIPLYLSSVADARTKTCQANMQTIANAVQAAHVKNTDVDYSTYNGAVTTAAEPDLQAVPICPNNTPAGGNKYTIVAVPATATAPASFSVMCGNGDGTFTPGVGVTNTANKGAGGAP